MGPTVGGGSGIGEREIDAGGNGVRGKAAGLGKPLTSEVKQEGPAGAFCTLREDGRCVWAGWAHGKFDCKPGERHFKEPEPGLSASCARL